MSHQPSAKYVSEESVIPPVCRHYPSHAQGFYAPLLGIATSRFLSLTLFLQSIVYSPHPPTGNRSNKNAPEGSTFQSFLSAFHPPTINLGFHLKSSRPFSTARLDFVRMDATTPVQATNAGKLPCVFVWPLEKDADEGQATIRHFNWLSHAHSTFIRCRPPREENPCAVTRFSIAPTASRRIWKEGLVFHNP